MLTIWLTEKRLREVLWSHKLFLFGIVALFSYEIAEISINSFLSIMWWMTGG